MDLRGLKYDTDKKVPDIAVFLDMHHGILWSTIVYEHGNRTMYTTVSFCTLTFNSNYIKLNACNSRDF